MLEKKIQIEEYLKLIPVIIFACLYAWGGMEYKWLRRFLAPSVLTTGMFIFYRNWRVFLQLPLMIGGLSLGYGGDSLWVKVLRRTLFGTAVGGSAAVHRNWKLFVPHIILCVTSSIYFGIWNPFGSARAEELILGLIYGLLVMYMPKKRGR